MCVPLCVFPLYSSYNTIGVFLLAHISHQIITNWGCLRCSTMQEGPSASADQTLIIMARATEIRSPGRHWRLTYLNWQL